MNYFVSGGSRGIGRAIVLGAVSAGHDVAFTYHTDRVSANETACLAVAAGSGRCAAYEMDVRSSAMVEQAADAVLADFGDVDVVVANAGVNRPALAASTTDDDWNVVLETNLTGAFFVARQFLPALLAKRFGRLIFVSSVAARGMAGQACYAASKAGLVGLAGALAHEYGSRGITCNVVTCGLVDTAMSREHTAPGIRTFWERYCPIGRIGRVEEVAAAVLYLSSREAGFVNGQELGVSGGLDWMP